MKKINPILLFSFAFLFYLPITLEGAVPSTITTTAGAAPSATSGMYFPSPGMIGTPQVTQPQISPQSGANLKCVDSGVQGRRCGIEAVTFCRLNPDAINCQSINNDSALINK